MDTSGQYLKGDDFYGAGWYFVEYIASRAIRIDSIMYSNPQ
jgi:hypothetical protein